MVKKIKMTKGIHSLVLKAKKLSKVSLEERQKIFREIVANARKPKVKKRRVFLPKPGTIGVSGPRGRLIQSQMIARISQISKATNHPNRILAEKLDLILRVSRSGAMDINEVTHEHQLLLNIMNKVLANESKPLAEKKYIPTNEQLFVLDKWFSRAKSISITGQY